LINRLPAAAALLIMSLMRKLEGRNRFDGLVDLLRYRA